MSDLKLSGFVLNVQKSCLEPQQIGKWLGFNLDLLEGKFYVPNDKLASLKSVIRNAFPFTRVPVKCLAKIVGENNFYESGNWSSLTLEDQGIVCSHK